MLFLYFPTNQCLPFYDSDIGIRPEIRKHNLIIDYFLYRCMQMRQKQLWSSKNSATLAYQIILVVAVQKYHRRSDPIIGEFERKKSPLVICLLCWENFTRVLSGDFTSNSIRDFRQISTFNHVFRNLSSWFLHVIQMSISYSKNAILNSFRWQRFLQKLQLRIPLGYLPECISTLVCSKIQKFDQGTTPGTRGGLRGETSGGFLERS